VLAGLVRTTRPLTLAGLTWLGVTVLKLALYDALELDARLRSWSFLAVGACVLLAGYAYQLLGRRDRPLEGVAVAGSLVPLARAYLVLAFGWTIGEQAPPSALLRAHAHPASGIGSVAIVAVASALFARLCLFEDARWRSWSGWAAGVVAVYGLSLAILELFQLAPGGGVKTNFQRGHTGVSAFWGALGLALLYMGLTRGQRVLRLGGFVLFGISLVKLFLYDLAFLNSVARALSFLAVGAVLLLGGFFYQRLSARLE